MAEVKPSYDTNRTNLREVIPLSGPFGMYIEPTRVCNLKCYYCMHATRGNKDGALAKTGFKIQHIEMTLYDKIINEIMAFPNQPKRVTFSGLGEPLMNPKLGEMARRLRNVGFTGRNDIITNGVALTPALSDELVSSGINRILISVQGLSSEAYNEIADVHLDFGRYIENISYMYKHKKNTEIFIKIIDANLRDESEKEQFFDFFGSICDTIFIEHLVVMEHQMGDHDGKADRSLNLNSEPFEPCDVCGIMFYFLQTNVDGDTFPCSTPGLPVYFSMGNVNNNTLREIWDGQIRNRMLRGNLSNGYRSFPACRECSSVVCITNPAERLDDCRYEILERFPE